jgi:hypothetical protein
LKKEYDDAKIQALDNILCKITIGKPVNEIMLLPEKMNFDIIIMTTS